MGLYDGGAPYDLADLYDSSIGYGDLPPLVDPSVLQVGSYLADLAYSYLPQYVRDADDGTVYAVSAEEGVLRSYGPGDEGKTVEKSSRGLEGIGADDDLSITVVGTTAFVLDDTTHTLYGSEQLCDFLAR